MLYIPPIFISQDSEFQAKKSRVVIFCPENTFFFHIKFLPQALRHFLEGVREKIPEMVVYLVKKTLMKDVFNDLIDMNNAEMSDEKIIYPF